MVVVNRLTKYTVLIPFKEIYIAPQMAYVLFNRIICEHRVPKTIISDRDKLFISNF